MKPENIFDIRYTMYFAVYPILNLLTHITALKHRFEMMESHYDHNIRNI